MAAQIDYDSDLWEHVEKHIEQHCFDTISPDSETRERCLAAERPSQLLQAICAAAEQIAQRPASPKRNGIRRLILVTLQEVLPVSTVQAITAFLASIGPYPSPTATDYRATIRCLRELTSTASSVHDAVANASTLHGVQGQLAYDLLKTAHLLIIAAEATLKHDSRYMTEKLTTAIKTIHHAQSAARRWQPDRFPLDAE